MVNNGLDRLIFTGIMVLVVLTLGYFGYEQVLQVVKELKVSLDVNAIINK